MYLTQVNYKKNIQGINFIYKLDVTFYKGNYNCRQVPLVYSPATSSNVSPTTFHFVTQFNKNKILAELGDYQVDEHEPNYLSNMQLVPGMNEDMERKISELHKLHK